MPPSLPILNSVKKSSTVLLSSSGHWEGHSATSKAPALNNLLIALVTDFIEETLLLGSNEAPKALAAPDAWGWMKRSGGGRKEGESLLPVFSASLAFFIKTDWRVVNSLGVCSAPTLT